MSPRAGNPQRDSSLQQGPTTGGKSSPHFSTGVGLHNTSYTHLVLSYGRARGAVLSASPAFMSRPPGRQVPDRLSSESQEETRTTNRLDSRAATGSGESVDARTG